MKPLESSGFAESKQYVTWRGGSKDETRIDARDSFRWTKKARYYRDLSNNFQGQMVGNYALVFVRCLESVHVIEKVDERSQVS